MSIAAMQRRDAFIRDIVEVCKKHRVMIDPEGCDLSSGEVDVMDVLFSEDNAAGDSMDFYVSLIDIEDEIRTVVWPLIHGL